MEQMRERMRQEAIAETKQTTKSKDDDEVTSDDWTEDQTQLLIKAVNLFPAGTASRYMYNKCIQWNLYGDTNFCPGKINAHNLCITSIKRIPLLMGHFSNK